MCIEKAKRRGLQVTVRITQSSSSCYSSSAEGGDDDDGKSDTNYRGQAVRKGVRGPNILHMLWFLVGPSLLRGTEEFFHGAPNPLSATLTSWHIETYQIYFVTVFRLSSSQTWISRSPPSNPQSCWFCATLWAVFSLCYQQCLRSRNAVRYSAWNCTLRPYK
jgi:hypothetical protein